jgi:hypothetical protein
MSFDVGMLHTPPRVVAFALQLKHYSIQVQALLAPAGDSFTLQPRVQQCCILLCFEWLSAWLFRPDSCKMFYSFSSSSSLAGKLPRADCFGTTAAVAAATAVATGQMQ